MTSQRINRFETYASISSNRPTKLGLTFAFAFVAHFIGTFLTNVAYLSGTASFVNTIKVFTDSLFSYLQACDPLFAAVGAKYVLGQKISFLTFVSLCIIVSGIVMTSITEFEFQYIALLSVLTNF